MKQLVEHLKFLLRRHNSVAIPRLGSLNCVTLPAFIDNERRVFLPPTRTVYFEPSHDVDGTMLAQSYSRRMAIDAEQSLSILERTVDQLKLALKLNGMVILGRIGQFYLKNGRIEFRANFNSAAYNPYFIFPEIENSMSVTESNSSDISSTGLRRAQA